MNAEKKKIQSVAYNVYFAFFILIEWISLSGFIIISMTLNAILLYKQQSLTIVINIKCFNVIEWTANG